MSSLFQLDDFDPDRLGLDEIVAVDDEVNAEKIQIAYSRGIFPWPQGDGVPLCWFSPKKRGVLLLNNTHLPSRLHRLLKQKKWNITMDQAFPLVIEACAQQARPGQDGTWITPDLIDVYCELNSLGVTHSFEVWQDEALIGGLYGVDMNGVFSGESMFFAESGASKAALYFVLCFQKYLNRQIMDMQMVTPVSEIFGADYVSRKKFYNLLREQKNFKFGEMGQEEFSDFKTQEWKEYS